LSVVDHRVIDIFALSGAVLDALGGLYLAYDLLGGKYGPLRTLTRCTTYAIPYGLGYALIGRWFGVIGGLLMGPITGVENSRRAREGREAKFESTLFASSRGVAFAIASWPSASPTFAVLFGLLSAIFLILAYRLAGSPGEVWVEQAKPQVSKVTWVVFVSRGLAVSASSIVAGALTGTPGEFALGLKIGLVAGSLSGLTNAFGPLVEWWADNLSPRRLGAFGTILLLTGFCLQSVQYVLPLFNVPIR
jgi:hypothetical protein